MLCPCFKPSLESYKTKTIQEPTPNSLNNWDQQALDKCKLSNHISSYNNLNKTGAMKLDDISKLTLEPYSENHLKINPI